MSKVDFDKMTRNFLMGITTEGKKADALTYIQSVMETLQSFNPRTKAGDRRLSLALEHMKHLRRHTRRLEERVKVLEEQIQVLEEGS